MKRKVNLVGQSTLTVSLPNRWVKKYGIKKGGELDVVEEGDKLLIKTESASSTKDIMVNVDVSGLDRTSIVLMIQSLYRYGYKTIEVYSKDTEVIHFRKNSHRSLSSVVQEAVNRLIGAEITQSSLHNYTINYIPEESDRNFKTVLRRVFGLLLEMMDTLYVGLERNDKATLDSIEFQQINTIKFINYCLRSLNIYGYPDVKKTCFYYYTISSISKLHNFIINCSRNIIRLNLKLDKKSLEFVKKINDSFKLFYGLFYDYDYKKIYELDENRDRIKNEFFDMYKTLPKDDIFVISSLIQIVEIILDLMEVRMGLEY